LEEKKGGKSSSNGRREPLLSGHARRKGGRETVMGGDFLKRLGAKRPAPYERHADRMRKKPAQVARLIKVKKHL